MMVIFKLSEFFLKYDYNGVSVIEDIKRCSRPGQRIYVGSKIYLEFLMV